MLSIQPPISTDALKQKFKLNGTIDIEARSQLENLYLIPESCVVILDFTAIKRVNSMGLAQLLKLFEYWQKRHVRIHITNANRMTSVLFKMTGLTRLLDTESAQHDDHETQAAQTETALKKEPLLQPIKKTQALNHSAKTALIAYHDGKAFYNKKEYEQAFLLFKKAAELGDANGQFYMGLMHSHGYGVEKDYLQAVKWFRQSAKQGNAHGQINLGTMYGSGYGVAKDYAKAMRWFKKAALQGDAAGQNKLGFMYENGYGVAKDYQLAISWYEKAAQQGNDYAIKRLTALKNAQL